MPLHMTFSSGSFVDTAAVFHSDCKTEGWGLLSDPIKHNCRCSNPWGDLHSVVSVGTFPNLLADPEPVMLL